MVYRLDKKGCLLQGLFNIQTRSLLGLLPSTTQREMTIILFYFGTNWCTWYTPYLVPLNLYMILLKDSGPLRRDRTRGRLDTFLSTNYVPLDTGHRQSVL